MATEDTETTMGVRPDIVTRGERQLQTGGYNPSRKSPKALIAEALTFLNMDNGHCSLSGITLERDGVTDQQIKKALRIWMTSWVIPRLTAAYDKLK